MIRSFGSGAFSNCSRIPGRLSAGIVAGHDEQGGGLEPVGRAAGRRAEEYEAIDLARLRSDRGVAGGPSSHTGSHNRHAFRTRFSEVADSGEDVLIEWSVHRVGIAWTSRLAVAAKVEG